MNSKLEGKIGRLELKLNKELKQQLSLGREIAVDKTYYFEAQMKHSEKWYKARVLDCRLSKGTVESHGFYTTLSLSPTAFI